MSDLMRDRLIKMQSQRNVLVNIGSLPIKSWCGTWRFYKEKLAVTVTNSLIVDAILYLYILCIKRQDINSPVCKYQEMLNTM